MPLFLAFSGHLSWLQYDRRVLDHEFPKRAAQPLGSSHQSIHQASSGKCAVVLYFLIKYVRSDMCFLHMYTRGDESAALLWVSKNARLFPRGLLPSFVAVRIMNSRMLNPTLSHNRLFS